MSKIFVLLGKSGAGKTSIERMMLYENNLETTTLTTTRPKRTGEKQDVQYHFVSEDRYKELVKKGRIICHSEFNTWKYGIDIKANNMESDKNILMVSNPIAYSELKQIYGDRVVGIFFKVETSELLRRGLQRGDNADELVRRLSADSKDFAGIEKEVDYIIECKDKMHTYREVHNIIYGNRPKVLCIGDLAKVRFINSNYGSHLKKYSGMIVKIIECTHVDDSRKFKAVLMNNTVDDYTYGYFFENELEYAGKKYV